MNVDRHDPIYDAVYASEHMEQSDCGDYVLYDDYEALVNDYNILRRDYQAMMDKLKDIWWEG